MRFTAFSRTQSVCGGDSILAAAQILTPGLSERDWGGREPESSPDDSSVDGKVEDYNARNA
jgi:hypothetical protein